MSRPKNGLRISGRKGESEGMSILSIEQQRQLDLFLLEALRVGSNEVFRKEGSQAALNTALTIEALINAKVALKSSIASTRRPLPPRPDAMGVKV